MSASLSESAPQFQTGLGKAASQAQELHPVLGAQAPERGLREVVTAGGFQRFRRAAETPCNRVYEARP